uniref:Intimal thickness related receptor IRP domain-containing protein n=1 Tax=Oryza meridionalis TaxID=40149 RepID=A0A0E0CA05_9ORYZ
MAASTAYLLPLLIVLAGATLHQAAAAHAMHESFKDDPRPLILLGKFRFSRNGSLSIAATASGEANMKLKGPCLSGFFLLPDGMRLDQVFKKMMRTPTYRRCILSSRRIVRLVTFAALNAGGRYEVGSTFPITRAGEYSLYFANCVPGTRVTMDVRVELSDSSPDGGEDPVAMVYSFFAVCYGVFLIAWLHRTLARGCSTARPVHDVMSGLLAALMLHCLAAAAYDGRYTSVGGTARGWNVPCLALRLVKNAMLFPVVALIGAGWSLPEPFVPGRELNVLTAMVPLQVYMAIATTLSGDASAFTARGVAWTWSHAFVLVQLACCVAVLMPMGRAIRALRKEADTDDKAARRLGKLALFRQLYLAVAVYLYHTWMPVFILKLLVGASSGYRWASVAVEEAAALAFYLFMFCMFSPAEEDIQLEEDTEELIQAGV